MRLAKLNWNVTPQPNAECRFSLLLTSAAGLLCLY